MTQHLTAEQVCERLRVSRSTINRMNKQGGPYHDSTFPQPKKVTANRRLWNAEAIDKWLNTVNE